MPRASLAAKLEDADAREHPEPEMLERFMRVELSLEESRAVIRHLLTGCRQCRYITGRLWKLGAKATKPPEAILKKKMRWHRRQVQPQGPTKRKRRAAAMAALEDAAQEMLQEIVQDLEKVRGRLEALLGGLPPPSADDEEDDVRVELRAVISCVLADSLKPAIEDLRDAAVYPEEPPEEDGSGGEVA